MPSTDSLAPSRYERFLASPWLGLAVVLAVLLPFRLWRASMESSLWMDEEYTLGLVHSTVRRIVDLTLDDVHPPTYYFALKGWLHLARRLGFEPGIVWLRLPGVIMWCALTAMAWFAGRDFLCRRSAFVLAWCMGGSAMLGDMVARDARSYIIAVPAAFFCFWMLLRVIRAAATARPMAGSWWAYAIAGLVGLWTHLLTGPVLALLGVTSIAAAKFITTGRRRLIGGSIVAHTAIAIGFLPWLVHIPQQLAARADMPAGWLTPSTPDQFFYVLCFWFPHGALFGIFYGVGRVSLTVLGFLTILVPVMIAISSREEAPAPQTPARTEGWCAVAGLGIGVAFILTLMISSALNADAKTFFGARYPVFGLPMWIFGLVALGTWALKRHGWSRDWLWMHMAPWLVCCIVAFGGHVYEDHAGSLKRAVARHPEFFPDKGGEIFVMPSEFISFRARELSRWKVRRIEDLAEAQAPNGEITVLDLNVWRGIDRERDAIARALITQKVFSREVPAIGLPTSMYPDYIVYRMQGVDLAKMRSTLASGIRAKYRNIPTTAAAVALPESQGNTEGWHQLETSTDLDSYRWSKGGTETLVRFDRVVPPGQYRLHVVGFRNPYPHETDEMTFRFVGDDAVHRVEQPAGGIDVQWDVSLYGGRTVPRLIVTHPPWRPKDFVEGSGDPRRMGFLFNYAWLEHLQ